METEAATRDRPISFGIRFVPAEGPESTGRLARMAEEGGFGYIWSADSPLLATGLYDPYVDLASVALNTQRVQVGPCVSPLFLRSPIATAGAILSLDRISNGRAVLGLGTGGSALATLGVNQKENLSYTSGAVERQAILRDQVIFFRKLFAGEPVTLGKRDIHLEGIRPVKVYVSATGPKALELAGAIADGVIVQVGTWLPWLKDAVARVRRGAENAGRDPDSIDLMCAAFTMVSPDGNRQFDIDYIRPRVSVFYSNLPKMVQQAGFDITRRFPEKMPYPDMTHAYDWEEAMAAARTYIPDEATEKFCLVGPPEDAVRRIREIAELGFSQFYVHTPDSYRLPHGLVKTFSEQIIPHFQGVGATRAG